MRVSVAICCLVAASLARNVTADTYYIRDNGRLQAVENGNPAEVHAEKWVAYYFPKGAATHDPSRAWGQDDAQTAAELLKKVDQSQQFEKRWEKWCSCSWGRYTHFNVLAPVAVTEKHQQHLDSRTVAVIGRIHDQYDKVKGCIDIFNRAAEVADGTKIPELQGPLGEYAKALRDTVDRYEKIEKVVTLVSDPALRSLEQSLDAFDKAIKTTVESSNKVSKIIAASASNSPSVNSSLLDASSKADLTGMKAALDAGANADAAEHDGRTALMYASEAGNSDGIRLLLDAGADPNRRDADDNSALLYAAAQGDERSVTLLLEHNADPKVTNAGGASALSVAISQHHERIANLLRQHGAQ